MSELKVRFLPEGGFEKNGAFIEYEGDEPTGEETEYQRQGYLTLDIACSELKIITSLGVICEYEEVEKRQYSRAIRATGVIQPARWGRYSLSFLGEKSKTDRITVTIRENAIGEAATLAGLKFEGDLDIEEIHEFFLEIEVQHERFATLIDELSHPDAVLKISARADRFRGFYARWSPSISDGRVIKFLDEKRDVKNADEIPEDFWRSSEFERTLLSDSVNPPVTIDVGRPLRPIVSAPTSPEYEEDRDIDKDTPPSSVAHVWTDSQPGPGA
ncbi:hypothetical protein [Roseovarius salinarum]|uniref:hypothetical protein n=1 Tax=Roseovarius salinarum TaxID=1981892 RepID=UPI0012FFE8E9|nr:hypothetical protein [Roseovarius salinarum]